MEELILTISACGDAEDLATLAAFLQERLNDAEMETGVAPHVEWERRVKRPEGRCH